MSEGTQETDASTGDVFGREDEFSLPCAHGIRAIVFDLDGTLYVSDEFAASIQQEAASYLAGALGTSLGETRKTMAETRRRLTEEQGGVATLSGVCGSLGGSVAEMHAFFREKLAPESFLTRDQRVVDLLGRLRTRFKIYLYTNNNRALSEKITQILGIDSCFDGMFTIDDDWKAKPDSEKLDRILGKIGVRPGEALFVGDRYDVDLQVPEKLGCPVYLSQSVDQLLLLNRLLTNNEG